ncbi:MAG: adenylate cyclase [Anaerocolumna sp.]|jgi:CYTH domain-containing protein|nr:adenylate cyclase [Anaerocolumna sp.]
MEIEKKYRIRQMPSGLDRFEKREIEQGYLCNEPVVRIRKSNDDYYMTYKSRLNITADQGTALCCEEVELALTKESFEHLKEKVDNNLIKKIRYIIPLEKGLRAELDIFLNRLDGLTMVEVEFPDEESAGAFNPPDWFGEDVTFDNRFKNNYLATVNSLSQLSLRFK